MNIARTRLAAILAFGTALAMPLAFAQTAVTPEVREAQKAATAAEASAQDAEAAAQQATTAADTQPASRQLGWNDVDTDGNGSISREESAALPALAAVFDEADADGDGELTPDEYRAHAANAGGES